MYGAGPLHLVAVLASFLIAAYALSRALSNTGNPNRILLWLGGSIVAHDLVLFPLYALVGVSQRGCCCAGPRAAAYASPRSTICAFRR